MDDFLKQLRNLNLNPKLIFSLVAVLLVVLAIASSFYVVDQTEESVILRFGKYNRTSGPGLHFKIPLAEKKFNVPTKIVQTMAFGFRANSPSSPNARQVSYSNESVMLTGDLNIIEVQWIIQYLISDPRAWLFKVAERERTIRDISQSVINQLVGDRTILGVIGPERTNIEVQSEALMNTILQSYDLGIHITTVKLQNIVPPRGEVQDAFEDVNKAIQDMNRLINEGQEAYNSEIPKTSGQANQIIQIAEGYAAERTNQARGDTARFNSVYAQYRLNPGTTRERLYYEMIESVFKDTKTKTDLIDKNLNNFIPFKNVQKGVTP